VISYPDSSIENFNKRRSEKLDLSLIDLPFYCDGNFILLKKIPDSNCVLTSFVTLYKVNSYTNTVMQVQTLYYFWSSLEKCSILGGSKEQYGKDWFIVKDQRGMSNIAKAITLLSSVKFQQVEYDLFSSAQQSEHSKKLS